MTLFCKKCDEPLFGKQLSYCSGKCSRRHLKSLWQKRKRATVNETKTKWRHRTNHASDRAWRLNNLFKEKAHKMVSHALKYGFLVRKPCEVCGSLKAQAHHPDYNFPLNVQWLCAQHHVETHQKIC